MSSIELYVSKAERNVTTLSITNSSLKGFVCFPFFFLHLASVYVFSRQSITFKQIAKLLDAIKSCRLVLQRAPMGSISVNTTFHLEPPAWQACLRICFGFGVYDYGNKSLVHSGSKLKRFYTHLKAWCFYWKHKRLSQGSCSLWHHPKQCLVAKSWNEVRTAPTVPDKDSFIKPMLPGCVLNTASKRACWRIRYFFSGLQTLNQKLIQAVIPGFSFSTLTVYPVTVGNCDTDRALCQGVSRWRSGIR